MSFLFKKAAIGGTFDILHKGHERLFREAFMVAEKVLIGITSDTLVTRLNKSHKVSSFDRRLIQVKNLLSKRGWIKRSIIVRIDDPYGPSVTDPELEVIIVSEETLPRAFEINELRVLNGLRPLAIGVVQMVLAENGKPISATRIRKGEIDRNGRLLIV